MQIAINPVVTTNAPGSFNISSEGYIQGTALNDPAIRNELAGGVLDIAASGPIWNSSRVPTWRRRWRPASHCPAMPGR